jgi:hypothetical protein
MASKTYKQALAALRKHTIHPAADLFPMIAEPDMADLARDIAEHGQQEPIWTDDDGAVLDGRNRLVACTMAGVAPVMRRWEPRAGDTPVAFVLSKNLHRRHLSASQRATIAVEMEPLIAAEHARAREQRRQAKAEQVEAARKTPAAVPVVEFSAVPPKAQGRARDTAARAVGVSAGYVNDAKDLRQADPDTFDQVKRGELTLPAAQEQVVTRAQQSGTLDRVGLRPGTVRTVLERQERTLTRRDEPKPRIRLQKFSKVASSRTTIQATMTFGNAKIAEEWLNRLQDDPKVLDLSFRQVEEKATRKSKSATG